MSIEDLMHKSWPICVMKMDSKQAGRQAGFCSFLTLVHAAIYEAREETLPSGKCKPNFENSHFEMGVFEVGLTVASDLYTNNCLHLR